MFSEKMHVFTVNTENVNSIISMELFERAHVTRELSSPMESKTDETVKRQLKQMMHAYRKGNNEGIRNSSEIKPKFDLEETSISDFTEFSMTKDSNNTVTSSDTSPAIVSQNNSSHSNTSENTGSTKGSLEDITESSEEFKYLSTSSKEMYDTEKSDLFESSSEVNFSDSNDSELSIRSSLLSNSTTNLSDYEEFDADGTLASEILKNLSKKDNNKRKKAEDDTGIKKTVIIKQKKEKSKTDTVKKSKKLYQEAEQGSKQKFVNSYKKSSDVSISGQTFQDFTEDNLAYCVTQSKKKSKLTQANPIIESSGDSMNDSMDSVSTSFSLPFISISAEDMSTQSLTDVLGDYVHPTIRNLPTDCRNIIPTGITSNMFPADTMFVNDVIDDEISSLIPEVDEELAIEDLILEPDTQVAEDSIHTEETIPDDISETLTADANVTFDTINTQLTADEQMKLYYGKDNYVLVMKHPSQLYIHGKLQIGIINGVADIFGYKLNYDSIDVYAPFCYFAQCLKTLDNAQGSNPNLYSELSSVGLLAEDTSEIVSNIQDNTAVIILTKLTNRRVSFVENNFGATDLFSKRVDKSPYFLKKAADNLKCSFYLVPPKKSFEEKSVWNEVYSSNREKSRGIVCGGKGTGKSTFLRHYVNSLVGVGPVLVIDLDPGQPEFTPPGVLSVTIVDRPILGPNFTHLKAPELMLSIGIINTMDNARRYLSAVRDIITYCRANEHFQDLPWIVNTMGLCNQMGLKFITYVILEVQPTFLLQIDSKTPKKRFEVELDPLTITQMYDESYCTDRSFRNIRNSHVNYNFVISRNEGPKGPLGSVLQPRDERYLNILAYFGELLQDNRSRGLTELVPYEVDMKDLSVGLNVKIPDVPVAKVINGKIIALCQQTVYDKGQVFTLGDNALLCHGHGLIRGLDYNKGVVYVLTPTPIGKLSMVNTLVYSDWMPELRGQEQELPSGITVPYRTANAQEHHQRMLMFPPRRRFNPIQLLKMTRST